MSLWSLKTIGLIILTLAASLFLALPALAQGPGTTFSYQGSLRNGDTPVNDTCTLEFKLFDAAVGGGQLGATQTAANVMVSQGLFTVDLDFGTQVFTGPPRYLEIGVRCHSDSSLIILSPRQALHSTPYAMYATQTGGVAWSDVSSKPNLALITQTISGLSCSDGQIAKWNAAAGQWECAADGGGGSYSAGAGLELVSGAFAITPTYRLPQSCANLQIPKWNGTGWVCADDSNTAATYTAGTGITIANDVISSTVPHPANVIWVAKSGGDFTSIQAALNSITTAAAANRYLVKVAPGVYPERVTMKPYVDIEGSGEDKTIISWTAGFMDDGSSATVTGANNAGLRWLTVTNTGNENSLAERFAIAIYNNAASPRLTHVTVAAAGASSSNYGVYNRNASPALTDVTATASGIADTYGVYNDNLSAPIIRDSTLTGATGSLHNGSNSRAIMATSQVSGPLEAGAGVTCTDVRNGEGDMLDSACRPGSAGQSLVAAADGSVSWQNPLTYTAGAGLAIADGVISSTLTAGTGLSLSGETVAITPTYRLPQSCAGGQIPKWNGAAWLCAADANTTYAAGTGIAIAGGVISSTLTAGADIIIANDVISSTAPHPANVVWVAKSGGNFTSIQAALNSITTASDTNRYLVKIAPGVYTERVTMKPYVDIEGAGELPTKITFGGSDVPNTGTVVGANNAELRFLTVENTGGNWFAIAIYNNAAAPRLTHVTAAASGGSRYNYGVYNNNASPAMTNVIAAASGGGVSYNYGVYNDNSSPAMTNVTATALAGYHNTGVYNNNASPAMTDVTATALGSSGSYSVNCGVFNENSSPTMTGVIATASGARTNEGVTNENSSLTMTGVTATGSGGTYNTGVYNFSNSLLTIHNSTLRASGGGRNDGLFTMNTGSTILVSNSQVAGSTHTISNDNGNTIRVGATLLEGGPVENLGTLICAGVYDENYTFYPDTCP